MKQQIIRKAATFLFILTTAFAAFANTTANTNSNAIFGESAKFAPFTNTTDIPQSILDTDFTIWQSPRPVPVIPSFANADVAWTDGFAIYYNPQIAGQMPPKILAFVTAHEYGHILMRANEVQADQFAARAYADTDMSVVYAAIWHMANMQPNTCDATHPCGWQRAYIIGQAAGLSPAEIESIKRGQF